MAEHNQTPESFAGNEEADSTNSESNSVADNVTSAGVAVLAAPALASDATATGYVAAGQTTTTPDPPAETDSIQELTSEGTPYQSTETGSYQLPNGMVGKRYQVTISLEEWGFKQQPVLHPDFNKQLRQFGVEAEANGFTLQLTGVPTEQGEHTLQLYYTYDDQKIVHKRITWLINADPKSLWKDIEPDENQPHRKPHTNTGRIFTQDFQLIAASRRGRSHAHEGKFREDDFVLSQTSDGWHILLVADGAGSASFSREGSRLACATGAQSSEASIANHLSTDFEALLSSHAAPETKEEAEREIKLLLYHTLCGAAFDAYKAIEQQAAESQRPVKDYATTFLLSIAKKFDLGTFVAAFWVGDGAICLHREDNGATRLLGAPDGGEFSGQTRFLTMRELIADSSEMLRRVHFEVVKNPTALMLMTDGISDPKFGTDKNLVSNEKWSEFWSELSTVVDFTRNNDAAPQQLLDWMDFWSPGEHDDRTIAILC